MTRIILGIYFLLLVDYSYAVYSTPMGNKIVQFDTLLGNCSNFNKQFNLVDFVNVTNRANSTFDYDLLISKPIDELAIHFHFSRCSSKEALNKCVPLPVFKIRNICNVLESSTQFWSPAILCLQPHLACPMKKTTYRGRRCRVNMNAFTFFPLGSAYFQLRIVMITNNREISCTTFEFGVK